MKTKLGMSLAGGLKVKSLKEKTMGLTAIVIGLVLCCAIPGIAQPWWPEPLPDDPGFRALHDPDNSESILTDAGYHECLGSLGTRPIKW